MGRKLAFGPSLAGVILGLNLASGSEPAFAATAARLIGNPAASPPRTPPSLPFRLVTPAAPLPATGAYTANDVPSFTLDSMGDQIRLRFVGSDEVFYLTSGPAPMGGRVLKYDTGEIALMVAGWGGVTLYTDETPSGIPAELQTASAPARMSLPGNARSGETLDVKSLAGRLSRDVALLGPFRVGFSADFETLSREDETTRALAADAMRNAAYALGRMADERERKAAAKVIRFVRVNPAAQPGAVIRNDALLVAYTPAGGPSARPSSLAIARVLAEGF
jgi:Domain of unknown function (DUF4908)